MHYTGCLAETGRCFDSSRARGHAFTFAIGCGRVIKGWDALLLSCSKGSRVSMAVAAADAYGAEGHPPNVPRNADLLFDVELLNINEPLVQEGIRFKQELEEIARQQVEAEQLAQVQRQRGDSGGRERGGRDTAGSDSESSYSSFSSESSGAARKRRRREKERKREKKERHREKKERKRQKREGGKGDKAARESGGKRGKADEKEKKESKRSRKG